MSFPGKTRIGALVASVALALTLASALPAWGGQMHTGLRAAAVKKCKQKYAPGARRKACLVKASHQPQ